MLNLCPDSPKKKERKKKDKNYQNKGYHTDPRDIKRRIKPYYKQFSDKYDNLDEIVQFFQGHRRPKLPQEEIDNLTNHLSIKESEFVVFKNLLRKKPQT